MERRTHHFHDARAREMPVKEMLIKISEIVERAGKSVLAKRSTPADIRMEKKLGMMRMALLDKMHKKMKENIDVDFMVEMIEFIARAEELIEQYEHDVSEWQEFLDLLERKLEREGVVSSDEDLKEQHSRLKNAVDKLRGKLDEKPFKPLE